MNASQGNNRRLCVCVALGFLSGAALAQQGAAAPPGPLAQAAAPAKSEAAAAVDPANRVEQITVTATRREMDLQDVTGTIDAVSAPKLEALQINDAQGVEKVVPGVTVARSGGITPFIRGIGTFNAGHSEASVGFYLDGIYIPNSAGVLFSFNNIERIEVLKGPQGTLYGRNTAGGLINVVTKMPGKAPALDASLAYGSFDTFTQNFYASMPLSENVAANLAVFHQKQSKGWSQNVFTGNEVQKSEDTGVYAKLLWQLGADTKVTLSGMHQATDTSKGWAFGIAPGTYGLDRTPYLGEYRISARLEPNAEFRGNLAALRIDQRLSSMNFFSLTGYQKGDQFSILTQNGIPGNPVAGQSAQINSINFDYKALSQEFQLSSDYADSRFNWIAGAFYYDTTTNVETLLYSTCVGNVCAPLAGRLPPQLVHASPTTKSYSAYADGTYSILKGTRLTLGLRRTNETKGYSGFVEPYPGLPNSAATLPASVIRTPEAAGIPLSVDYPKWTYRMVLAQDFTDNVMGYLSKNRGFKSGNYNPSVITNPPVRPEILDAYEAGLKSELLNGSLRLNASAFRYDYTDIQVRSNAGFPVGSASIAQNIAKASAKGIDLQFEFIPVTGLSLNGGYEYLDAKYDSYPGATCIAPRTPTATVLGGVISTTCDLAGYPLPISPKHSAIVGATYKMNTSVGQFTWVVNDSYKSEYTFTPDNSLKQKAGHLIDAALTWKPNRNYSVRLYAKNVTDRYTYIAGQAASTFVYVPGEPRTYGIMVGFNL